jgi:hypothetical protein
MHDSIAFCQTSQSPKTVTPLVTLNAQTENPLLLAQLGRPCAAVPSHYRDRRDLNTSAVSSRSARQSNAAPQPGSSWDQSDRAHPGRPEPPDPCLALENDQSLVRVVWCASPPCSARGRLQPIHQDAPHQLGYTKKVRPICQLTFFQSMRRI